MQRETQRNGYMPTASSVPIGDDGGSELAGAGVLDRIKGDACVLWRGAAVGNRLGVATVASHA
jgi:hypothetical protein